MSAETLGGKLSTETSLRDLEDPRMTQTARNLLYLEHEGVGKLIKEENTWPLFDPQPFLTSLIPPDCPVSTAGIDRVVTSISGPNQYWYQYLSTGIVLSDPVS